MLEDLWTSILEFTSRFVIPDWGGLIALLPVAIFALVLVVLVIQFWRIARAAPARRGKARIEPRPPAGVHMPGPSFAPIFAGVGLFDRPPLVLERQLHRGADALIVFDRQDAGTHGQDRASS